MNDRPITGAELMAWIRGKTYADLLAWAFNQARWLKRAIERIADAHGSQKPLSPQPATADPTLGAVDGFRWYWRRTSRLSLLTSGSPIDLELASARTRSGSATGEWIYSFSGGKNIYPAASQADAERRVIETLQKNGFPVDQLILKDSEIAQRGKRAEPGGTGRGGNHLHPP